MNGYMSMDSVIAFGAKLVIPGAEPRPIVAIIPRHEQIPAGVIAELFPSLPADAALGWLFFEEVANERRQTLLTDDLSFFNALQLAAESQDTVEGIELPLERFRWRCLGWPNGLTPNYGAALVELPHRRG